MENLAIRRYLRVMHFIAYIYFQIRCQILKNMYGFYQHTEKILFKDQTDGKQRTEM